MGAISQQSQKRLPSPQRPPSPLRYIVKRPFFFEQMCVNPRKSNVCGFSFKVPQDRFHLEPREILFAGIGSMAGPRVFDRVLDKLCANGIEVDVRRQLQQVFIGVNEDRSVPSLVLRPSLCHRKQTRLSLVRSVCRLKLSPNQSGTICL